MNLIQSYLPTCTAVYNNKVYTGHAGLQGLFNGRFTIGDIVIPDPSISVCMAGDAILINVFARAQDASLQPTQGID